MLTTGAGVFFSVWGEPVEDAAMVFTYSENIAAGYGVVYNPGGERVDGTSDLVLAFVLAGLVGMGVPVEIGAGILNGLGLGVIVLLIFLSWSRPETGRRWLGFAAVALFLASTPVLLFGTWGFGTLVFAAMVTTTAHLSQRAGRGSSAFALVVLGLSVALAGMNRVEGFFLAGLIVIARAVAARSLRVLAIPAATAGLIAVAWLSWRISYFGYPLPNPFYRKGGGALYPSSLWLSLWYVTLYLAPWLPVFVIALFSARTRRSSTCSLALIVVPWALLWILLSDAMNHLGRFQFPISPVLAVISGSLIAPILPTVERTHCGLRTANRLVPAGVLIASCALLTLGVPIAKNVRELWRGLPSQHTPAFHREVAEAIGRAATADELIVTTEAGMVAWRTGLPVLDLWGLNNKEIAHRGLLTPDQIRDARPGIIFAHIGKRGTLRSSATEIPGGSGEDRERASWNRMNVNLFCYAEQDGFGPVAVWGEELDDWWVVLAKSGSPLADRLETELAGVRFGPWQPSIETPLPRVRDCPPA